ncbi:MAG TPA: FAD-dependent oxidoreductase [Gammaproteobacteria bacterium]|nr:FAD-dependent oxidoreductase [Gammaproteobacteria bacterium]
MSKKRKVIVVGAGIAGLAACRQLIDHGFDALILEAQGRYGGRILTSNTFGFSFGLGASWIHGIEGNPITQLANHACTEMSVVNRDKFIRFNSAGNPISQSDVFYLEQTFQALLNDAKELAFKSQHDIPLSSAIENIIKEKMFSKPEQDFFQAKLLSFESYLGASSDSLSARYWDQEEIWPGENCFLTGSYQPIIDNLAKHCEIKLNTIVREVFLSADGVEVITDDMVFNADAVVLTIPLGVLKKNNIQFNPPLPEVKKNAIEKLGMGLLNITAIEFPHSFWPKENHALFFTHTDALSIPVFLNFHHFIQKPILIGYSGGKRAEKIERLTDVELIKKIMIDFKKIYGPDVPDPEAYLTTRWSSDPFSCGSYSFIPPGADAGDYDAMAESVLGRLFFAGEATSSRYPATTHGAYLSGIRESEKIIRQFKV